MKPEVRRALAKEWLILMGVAIVATLCRAGWLYLKNKELDERWQSFQRSYDLWSGDEKRARESFREEHLRLLSIKDRIVELPKENEDLSIVFAQKMKSWATEQLQATAQDRLGYPHPRTTQGWIASATWAVEWSWLAYLALWVPRLTVGSIRLLRNSANKRDQP
jgi:hypothetical protein